MLVKMRSASVIEEQLQVTLLKIPDYIVSNHEKLVIIFLIHGNAK